MPFPAELQEDIKKIVYAESGDMAELCKAEIDAIDAILMSNIDKYSGGELKLVSAIYRDPINRVALYDTIREVKKQRKGLFVGAKAQGEELTMVELRPQDVLRINVLLVTWVTAVVAGTAAGNYESGAGSIALQMNQFEGKTIMGWVDPIASPRTVAIQLERGGILEIPQVVDFEKCSDYPVLMNSAPWKITPLEFYRIAVRYHSAGNDSLRPLGFRIATASTLVAL